MLFTKATWKTSENYNMHLSSTWSPGPWELKGASGIVWEIYSYSHKTYGKDHISHICETLPIFLIPKINLIYLFFNLNRLPKRRLCVDMYVSPCICIHVYIFLCVYVLLCILVCIHSYLSEYLSMSICMYLCMCVSASEFFPHHVKTEKGH